MDKRIRSNQELGVGSSSSSEPQHIHFQQEEEEESEIVVSLEIEVSDDPEEISDHQIVFLAQKVPGTDQPGYQTQNAQNSVRLLDSMNQTLQIQNLCYQSDSQSQKPSIVQQRPELVSFIQSGSEQIPKQQNLYFKEQHKAQRQTEEPSSQAYSRKYQPLEMQITQPQGIQGWCQPPKARNTKRQTRPHLDSPGCCILV